MADFKTGLKAWRDICASNQDKPVGNPCWACILQDVCPTAQDQVVGDLDDEQAEELANDVEEAEHGSN